MASSPCPHSKDSSPEEEVRDWAVLPRDILINVFLCHEIMLGVERTCMAWRLKN
jgi:hypothetical protein